MLVTELAKPTDALLEQGLRLGEPVLRRVGEPEPHLHVCDVPDVPECAMRRERLLAPGAGGSLVTGIASQVEGTHQGVRAGDGRPDVTREDCFQATQPLLLRTPERPDPPERPAQPHLELSLPRRLEVVERCADVVVLRFEAVEPLVVLAPEVRLRLFGEG
jgi:hypothetical protein